MDTRTKIKSVQDAAPYSGRTAVHATFDVLTAPVIRQLRKMTAEGGPLLAIVSEEPDSLQPLRARAELAASLSVIEFVVMAEQIPAGLFPKLLDIREADRRRSAELRAHIARRHQAAANA